MKSIKALTNRHPVFLKAAYQLDGIVDLVNDEQEVARFERFIRFDPGSLSFTVYIQSASPVKVRSFPNIISAVNCARRV